MAAAAAGGASTAKRLQEELMGLMMSTEKDVSAFPNGDNLYEWTASITGSKETVYEGQTYKLLMKFPLEYPYSPPQITFETACWHPNVGSNGDICLDILKEKWSAAYSISTILRSLCSLLADPNNDSPLNDQAAKLWPDQEQFKRKAQSVYATSIQ